MVSVANKKSATKLTETNFIIFDRNTVMKPNELGLVVFVDALGRRLVEENGFKSEIRSEQLWLMSTRRGSGIPGMEKNEPMIVLSFI